MAVKKEKTSGSYTLRITEMPISTWMTLQNI
jgi:hypothetical protein